MSIDRTAAANAIDAFLRAIGREPSKDPDLVGTGARVTDAYVDELCAGYAIDTRAMLAESVITDAKVVGADTKLAGLVVVRNLAITTMCPHHLLPASGHATVAMVTRERLIGLGTIASLVDAHARRLTLQERIGEAVVSDLDAVLSPEWVGCRIVLSHGCMVARGPQARGSSVETVAFRGVTPATSAGAHQALGVGS